MSRHLLAVSLVAVAVAGCDVNTSDMLSIKIESEQPLLVDTTSVCADGGCDGAPLDATLTFEDGGFLPDTATVQLLQYRVDYTLAGAEIVPPFYAADTLVDCGLNEAVTFSVLPAGQRQRDWISDRYGPGAVAVDAILTVAGYDHANAQVQVSSESFQLVFGDYSEVAR